MTLSASTKTVTINANGDLTVRDNTTTILRGSKPIRFYCKHCGAIFVTTNHTKTRHGHSASCPCCPYAAWAK